MKTFIISISGHSGAGKSTLIEKLSSMMGNTITLRMDDYKSLPFPPAAKWIEDGANPNEFQTPQFFSDILALKNGKSILHPKTNQEVKPARLLFIEEPFGRGRQTIGDLIDFSIYVDAPLEVALARRLLRMSKLISEGDSDVTIEEHLQWYLRVGRNFFVAVEKNARKNCDLIVDGLLSTDEMSKIIIDVIKQKNIQNETS